MNYAFLNAIEKRFSFSLTAQHSEHNFILQEAGCFLQGLIKVRGTAPNIEVIVVIKPPLYHWFQ